MFQSMIDFTTNTLIRPLIDYRMSNRHPRLMDATWAFCICEDTLLDIRLLGEM